MSLLINVVVKILVLLITAYLVPGFHIDSYFTALKVVIAIGLLNLFIKPILLLFTLPLNILTLGLFTFVINAILLLLAANLVQGFTIDSLGTAIVASIIITIISALLSKIK